MDGSFHACGDSGRATQIATLLLGLSTCQVAGAALAVHAFALRRDAKPLLCAFVGFNFVTHHYLTSSVQLNFGSASC